MPNVLAHTLQPYVTNSRRSNPFARHASYRHEIERAFNADILPPRKKSNVRKFKEDELWIRYEHQRDWVDPVEEWAVVAHDDPQTHFAYRHEKYLDYLFWDENATNPVICVLGNVGSGKSTLTDFYLRCYCPEKGAHRDKFERKLVIKFDCRADPSASDLKRAFFHSAQNDILEQCKEQHGFDIVKEIRQQGYPPNDIHDWVWMALKCLSTSAQNPDTPFDYIVVFVDNLDQCSLDVQISMISTIEHYIADSKVDVWRFFLPLWPGTFAGLRAAKVNLLNDAKTFCIGGIQSYDLLRNRNRSIYSLKDFESLPELKFAPSGFLDGPRFKSYLLRMLQHIKNSHGDCISDITDGNLRRYLAIVGKALLGQRAFQVWNWREKEFRSEPRWFRFDTLLSLLSGENEFLEHDLHRVANVLRVGGPTSLPDLLAGYHGIEIMSHLAHRDQVHKTKFASQMAALKYSPSMTDAVYDDLFTLGLFHEEPNGRSVDNPIVKPHLRPCNAYLRLATSAEYLVAIAQVTPVDDQARENMAEIDRAKHREFVAETHKCIECIRFICRAEEAFVGRLPIDEVQISVFWQSIARVYYSRLVNLRESETISSMSDADWIPILNDPLFSGFHH